MSNKWFLIPIFLFLIFLVCMCFVALGKFASLAFPDGWWVIVKDASSILGSLSAIFGLPWAIWLYFKQHERDREDKRKEHYERKIQQLNELMSELLVVLVPDKLLTNQVIISSLIYRINTKRSEVDDLSRNEFDFSLRTHINQLFNNIEPKNLIGSYSDMGFRFINRNFDIESLSKENNEVVIRMAEEIVKSKDYKIFKLGEVIFISLEGFKAGLLSQLVVLAQPICKGNFTVGAEGGAWKEDKLKDLFLILPETIAAYIYIAYSEDGKKLIVDMDSET